MKLSQGQHTFTITTGGVTTVTALVYQQGNKINLGSETYTWNENVGLYVGDHVDATIDPKEDHTLVGYTGVPPTVYAYHGTWS